jgi:hypothetical protein
MHLCTCTIVLDVHTHVHTYVMLSSPQCICASLCPRPGKTDVLSTAFQNLFTLARVIPRADAHIEPFRTQSHFLLNFT